MKGYRTILVNVLTGLTLILAAPEVTGLLPEGSMPYVVAGQAILNIVMRFVTTTAVGERHE